MQYWSDSPLVQDCGWNRRNFCASQQSEVSNQEKTQGRSWECFAPTQSARTGHQMMDVGSGRIEKTRDTPNSNGPCSILSSLWIFSDKSPRILQEHSPYLGCVASYLSSGSKRHIPWGQFHNSGQNQMILLVIHGSITICESVFLVDTLYVPIVVECRRGWLQICMASALFALAELQLSWANRPVEDRWFMTDPLYGNMLFTVNI